MTTAADNGRWDRCQDLFHQALALPADERASFLDLACGDDTALRAEIIALIEADAAAPRVDHAAVSAAAAWLQEDRSSLVNKTLGRYRIDARIARGGMGEVFKAHDTRLARTVAIKVLPTLLARDEISRARFEREARAVAALSHPHICPVFDIGNQDGIDYLVMEYLEGETLFARLRRGTLAREEALQIAIEIADALDRAHRAGIVHRDLKPGNVMLTAQGAKLLDFGLARLQPSGTAVSDLQTGQSAMLGTVQYMSPEQLKAGKVDWRADIWAFGCVLYELMTGARAFVAATETALIAAILAERPRPIHELAPDLPAPVIRLIEACLVKDPDERWQSAGDLRHALEVIGEPDAIRFPASTTAPSRSHRRGQRRLAMAAIAGAAGLALIAALRTANPTAPAPRAVTRATLSLPEGVSLRIVSAGLPLAVSPNGRRVAYVGIRDGRAEIFLRSLDSDTSTALPDTIEAVGPAFSPDGEWLAFSAGGKLKKIPVRGGSPTTITEAPPNATLTWTDDDRLLYGGDGSPIREVSANSGPVRQITTAGLGAASHLYPTKTRNGSLIYSLSPARIVSLLAPGAREPRVLVTDASQARIVMGDMLVFGRASALWAAPVDAAGTVTGEPRLVLDAVKSNGTQTPLYAVASNGTLIYAKDTGPPLRSIVWVDRSGREEVVGLPARPYRLPRVSPDGRQLLLSTADGDQNLWRIDLQRSTSTRLTFNARPDFSPVWSFDGRTVFFTDTERVLRVRADGEGDVQVVLAAPEVSPTGITPDGKTLIVSGPGIQKDGRPNAHVGLLPLDAPRVIPLITDPGEQRNGTVSPDGRWLAYQSSESGQLEIYVRPFPDVATGKWQVSVGGGLQPIWSRNGRELFYRTRAGQVLAVRVRSGATLEVDPPKIIVAGAYAGDDVGPARSYDVTPDGQRFLFVKNLAGTDITELELVLNWDLALRASLANTGR